MNNFGIFFLISYIPIEIKLINQLILSFKKGGKKIKIIVDGSSEELDIKGISKRLKDIGAVSLKTEHHYIDIDMLGTLPSDSEITPVTTNSAEGLEIYRHSTSHILAHAVKSLYPEAKISIGPATEDGFYYDFDVETPFTAEDIRKIEKKMKQIIKKNNPFVRKTIKRSEAIELFKEMGEDYKVELLDELPDDEVSLYEEGEFVDLCRGPHVRSTGVIKAFKLLRTAGAYWRGDENNKMLQRIYGASFPSDKELEDYLNFLEEVKKRDHRRLGKELDLFSINDEIGSGLIMWHPEGALIRKTIEDFWQDEHLKADYNILYSPHIAKLNLWEKSGHWDFYRENMYSPMDIDGMDYEIKPMNCPFHISVYKSRIRSYKDLPVRYAELGTVYRYERSGVLHGLLRVRGFTQDDAHIFCRVDQIEDEISKVIDFTVFVLKTFGFDNYDIYLSTRPEKYVGSQENWDISTEALRNALTAKGLAFEIDPGEGVFYGPKIDIKVKDSLGRPWQCSTIQVDFNNPERFAISYRGSDDKEHMPIMIHRALMGSLERFFGILIEHYAGAFPLWLAPVQLSLLTVSERHSDYVEKLKNFFKSAGIRAETDVSNEKIGYKIRQTSMRKIPYSVVAGDKEVESKVLSLRKRNGDTVGPFGKEELLKILQKEIEEKALYK